MLKVEWGKKNAKKKFSEIISRNFQGKKFVQIFLKKKNYKEIQKSGTRNILSVLISDF